MDAVSPALVASHMFAFGLGALSLWLLVRRGEEIIDHQDHPEREDDQMEQLESEEKPTPAPGTKHLTWFGVVILVGSLLIVGFGIQQALYQNDRDDRDVCLNTWGQEFTEVFQERAKATAALQEAEQPLRQAENRRNNAVDDVLLVVKESMETDREDPEQQAINQARFTNALRRFTVAKAELVEAQAAYKVAQDEVTKTRDENPVPMLNCE